MVRSDIPLPALSRAFTGGAPGEIVVERAQGAAPGVAQWIHHWGDQDDIALSLARVGEDYWLRFPSLADFHLRFAHGRIHVFPGVGTNDNTLEHLLVDQVLPRFMAHRHFLVTHASAVAIQGRHAMFLGQSGRGKSTLAGLLHRSGCRVLSDDCVQLLEQGGRMFALSTYPSLRLLPDSLDRLFPGMDTTAAMAQYSDKRRVPVLPEDGDPVAVNVDALYVLGDPAGTQGELRVSRLPPADACLALIEHSFRLDLSDRDGNRHHFALCSAAARAIPAFELQYPRDYAQGSAIAEQIALHLSRLPPGN